MIEKCVEKKKTNKKCQCQKRKGVLRLCTKNYTSYSQGWRKKMLEKFSKDSHLSGINTGRWNVIKKITGCIKNATNLWEEPCVRRTGERFPSRKEEFVSDRGMFKLCVLII